MKANITIYLTLASCQFLFAQSLVTGQAGSSTNYALPVDATEVNNQISNVPDYQFLLSESGNVLSYGPSTCSEQTIGSTSSLGLALQHFYSKESFDQYKYAFSTMGGILGAFKKSIEDDYAHLEDDPYGRFAKKGPLLMEQLEGNAAASYTFTNNCIQDVNPFVTLTVFKLLLLTENDYVTIDIKLYAEDSEKGSKYSAEKARQYAVEMIKKIKSLDLSKVN